MSDLDRLPPDQRAVLSLVLERGRSYSEVADMLAIPESAVRDRAHAALDALAHNASDSARYAPSSAQPASGSARLGATDDRGLAGERTRSSERSRAGASAPTPERVDALSSLPPGAGNRRTAASSRRAGALLLAAIVVVIVVAVILLSGGGGGKGAAGSSTTTTTGTSSTSTSSATKPKLDKTLTLSSVEPTLKANGLAYVLSEGSRRAFYVAAQGLPASSGFFYAVWLYNSPTSSAPLGRAPNVGSDGRMEGGGPLPTNAGMYHKLIITRETSTHPSRPGPVVLSGPFALH